MVEMSPGRPRLENKAELVGSKVLMSTFRRIGAPRKPRRRLRGSYFSAATYRRAAPPARQRYVRPPCLSQFLAQKGRRDNANGCLRSRRPRRPRRPRMKNYPRDVAGVARGRRRRAGRSLLCFLDKTLNLSGFCTGGRDVTLPRVEDAYIPIELIKIEMLILE
ncbi:hypothetical protein EVAR_4733_1 [Eumeta japonica]|uniref:Uncharacterized protein n=1 Tax=Eumeta variegata TaxID=151549 RepID=A0A4C1SYL3_EUMVA|nr:hypothetical protein EVAR_4733_1 [Eumeta japonica]